MKLIWMGLVALMPVFARAQQSKFIDYVHDVQNKKIVGVGLFKNRPPTFDELERDRAQFQTPAEFMDHLFRQSPRLRGNSVLIHSSESQQLSSLQEPRILLFDGGIVYALSNHPGQKDRRVEIMEVDPSTYEVSMREIVFDRQGPRFDRNPQSCKACHGTPAKPLWNPYDFWPHAFGSAIGSLGSESEKKAYADLYAKRLEHPLLSRLNLPAKFNLDTENVTAFTQFIHQANLGRWIRQNLRPERFSRAQALPLIASLSFCAENSEPFGAPPRDDESGLAALFRPDEIKASAVPYSLIRSDVASARAFFKNYLEQVSVRVLGTQSRVDHKRLEREVATTAQIRWILNQAGIDTANLSTSLYANDVLISAPSNFPLDFVTSLYAWRPELFEGLDLEEMNLGLETSSWIRAECGSVQKMSRDAARPAPSVNLWKSFEQVQDSRPVLSRCAKCHVEHLGPKGRTAPVIPFDRPVEFAALLRDPQERLAERILQRVSLRGRGQMPPEKPLTDDEANALRAYLENLQP